MHRSLFKAEALQASGIVYIDGSDELLWTSVKEVKGRRVGSPDSKAEGQLCPGALGDLVAMRSSM